MPSKEPASFASIVAIGRRLLHVSGDPTSTHSDFRRWDHVVGDWLDERFPETGLSAEWSSISTSPLVSDGHYYNDRESWAAHRVAVQRRLSFLGELGSIMKPKMRDSAIDTLPTDPNGVFLVHGHDEGSRENVARYLEKLGLRPKILHEQPNRGKTIIEKLEVHSSVGFAVVLLTPDDIGGKDEKTLRPRARQNVILELGFFCGALGRSRVCALFKGDVEIPSDFEGVVYVPLDDSGAWRLALAREIKAAGISVDLNKAV